MTVHSPLDTLLDHAPDAMVTLDDDGFVVSFNDAAERLFGCDRAAVLGRPLDDLVRLPPTMADGVVDMVVSRRDGRTILVHVWLAAPRTDRITTKDPVICGWETARAGLIVEGRAPDRLRSRPATRTPARSAGCLLRA